MNRSRTALALRDVSPAIAARNNASWCDAVCRTHGRGGDFFASYWRTRAEPLPLYPNLVTLTSDLEPALAAVQELDRALPSATWAVKDSFAVLPLDHARFRVLFEAEWIVLAGALPSSGRLPRADGWFRIESREEVAAWETAWGESLGQSRTFLPSLLDRDDVVILGRRRNDVSRAVSATTPETRATGTGTADATAIDAGVIAHRAAGVVGLTNFFVHGQDRAEARREGVEAVLRIFPDLPLLAYETGPDRAEARALGFASIGPLRVWIKENGGPDAPNRREHRL